MTDVSDEPIDVAKTEVEGRGGMKMTVRQQYIPPLDGSRDLVNEFDRRIARGVAEVLVKTYFGYSWQVVADSRQGVVYFRIPELMGPTLAYVIRLAQYSDLTPELIARSGGELLERMNLPRSQIDMALYAAAKRNKHRFDFGDVKGANR